MAVRLLENITLKTHRPSFTAASQVRSSRFWFFSIKNDWNIQFMTTRDPWHLKLNLRSSNCIIVLLYLSFMKAFFFAQAPDYQDGIYTKSQWFGETLRCTREEAEKNGLSRVRGEHWRSDVTAVTSGFIKTFLTADWFGDDISSVSHVLQAKQFVVWL